MPREFVHLHVHSEYSLLDGAVRPLDLIYQAGDLGMSAVALTDHGNLFGAVDFYLAAKKAQKEDKDNPKRTPVNVKPILGCEVYLAPGAREDRRQIPGRKHYSHLTLLAENNAGWANLIKLSSRAYLEGFYYKPRVDKDLLREHREGIICLSGCLQGEINQYIVQDQLDLARASLESFLDIYGPENFFLEVHNHQFEAQAKCREVMRGFCKEYGLKPVAANDAHFLRREDHEAHDVLICIGTGARKIDEKRMHYSPELYLKSPEEMEEAFADWPEALDTTVEIANRCNVKIKLDSTSIEKYPKYDPPGDETRDECFRRLCEEGLIARYGTERAANDPELRERVEREIKLMAEKGFVSYFLIVRDFISWAREQGIPVGPGRGSAAGSLVAYLLGITDICPLRFGLVFERFLNPERVSPPDIDIDFCQDRRGEVIQYVREKYGDRSVSHIITFGKMLAKSAVRDVGRVLGWGFSETDAVAKMIPEQLGITLGEARKMVVELDQLITNDSRVGELWRYATYLEGLSRNAGVHAAGIIIGDGNLDDHVALARDSGGETITQFAMGPLTELGMLKMDFLGLKTLTVIHDALALIRAHTPDFELDKEGFDDEATFRMLAKGETKGVFQMESVGMIDATRNLGPDRIEDIFAILALYRPGPMQFIPNYIARKKGIETVVYKHPLIEQISRETYGILVYQEQVMQVANLLAGFSLGQADLLRRAMGKKDAGKMAEQRAIFVKGCADTNGIAEGLANDIFDLLEEFAKYGFNKSHSAAYGVVTYHTAYLKANHPVEFMSALLSSEVNQTKKITEYVGECRRMGIAILPPDVNRSGLKFQPEIRPGEKPSQCRAIRYGMSAIKNVGEGAVRAMVEERQKNGPFQSLEDFVMRLDTGVVNRKVLESLVRAGAFDWTGEWRWNLFARVEKALAGAASAQRDRKSGQVSLFDEMLFAAPPPVAADETTVEPWPKDQLLSDEKELLGFFVSGHPLDAYKSIFARGIHRPLGAIGALEAVTRGVKTDRRRKLYAFAGLVAESAIKYSKATKKPFLSAVLEDLTGSCEMMLRGKSFEACSNLLQKGAVVAVKGYVEASGSGGEDDRRQIIVEEAKPLAKPTPKIDIPGAYTLVLDTARNRASELDRIFEIVTRYPGATALHLLFQRPDGRETRVAAADRFRVDLDPAFVAAVKEWRPA
jgi:DNA polymerase-3 subunit alpha